jgi:hypothetical protein
LTEICGPRYTTGIQQIASIRRKNRKKIYSGDKISCFVLKNNSKEPNIADASHFSITKKIEYVIEANLCWTAIKEVE